MPHSVRLLVHRAGQIEEHQLDNEDLEAGVILGRGRDVNVFIHHPRVSRCHCRLQIFDGRVTLEDLGSADGTCVNNERLEASTTRVLNDGARLLIGPINVEFRLNDDSIRDQDTRFTRPLIIEDDDDDLPAHLATIPQGVGHGQKLEYDSNESDKPQAGETIDLVGNELVLGRHEDCDIVLNNLLLSRRHARLQFRDKTWFVKDLNSTNGTFVNGQQLRRAYALSIGDVLKIGPYEFVFKGDHLVSSILDEEGVAVIADALSKPVLDRDTGEPICLLDKVSLRIEPGEFVVLLGPSGCGKSTLMDALNGRRPVSEGRVFYNEDDLYRNFEAYKVGIGYVPQQLIFHENLPLVDALRYASRIRLSKDVTDEEIRQNIDDVLDTVGLSERRNTTIADLSGGQKKRVSLAIELLSKPNVLFLDEVTSGLDLGTEKEMMQLFRELSERGITVICITHFVDSLELCDRLVCLMRGRLVFFGTSSDLRQHFGIDHIAGIYDVLKNVSHTDKAIAVRHSERKAEQHRDEFVVSCGDPGDTVSRVDIHAERRMETIGKGGIGQQVVELDVIILQTRMLMQRYVQLLLRDRITTGILILLAPLIAIMLCILVSSIDDSVELANAYEALDFKSLPSQVDLVEEKLNANLGAFGDASTQIHNYAHKQRMLGFGAILTMLFLALFGSVQEVVKELRVYHHERFARLQIGPYMLSKLGPLFVLGAIQSALVVLVINLGSSYEAGSPLSLFVLLVATSLAGTCLGLAISAAVPDGGQGGSTDAATLAVMIMNAVVIPQVLFAGALVTLSGFSKLLAQVLVTGYWSFDAFLCLVGPAVDEALEGMTNAQLLNVAAEVKGAPSPFFVSLGVVLLHAIVFFALFGVALARKDGPEGFRTMLRKLPADSRALFGQARQVVRQKNAEPK